MRAPRLLSLLAATGCGQGHVVVADVSSPGGAALSGAVVSCVCEPRGNAVAESDANGSAVVEIDETIDIERCTITVAANQYRTQQMVLDRFCSSVIGGEPLAFTLEPE